MALLRRPTLVLLCVIFAGLLLPPATFAGLDISVRSPGDTISMNANCTTLPRQNNDGTVSPASGCITLGATFSQEMEIVTSDGSIYTERCVLPLTQDNIGGGLVIAPSASQCYFIDSGRNVEVDSITTASASRGLVPCGGPDQPDCQSCYVIALVNGVVEWLVGILGTLAAIIVVYAGFKLVTSAGNTAAKQQAKSLMISMAIGYAIVLSAWLVIDFGVKAMVNEGEFGVWNQVQCVEQPVAQYSEVRLALGGFTENRCDAGPGGQYVLCANQIASCSGTATINTSNPNEYTVICTYGGVQSMACEIGPSGARVICTNQTASCKAGGGTPTINTSNPNEYVVICEPAGGGGMGGGSCVVTTDPNNACHPSKLGCFGGTDLASKICNLESAGGQTGVMSGTDRCKTGHSFSGGLWQINILAHYDKIPGCNSSFFTKNGSGVQGTCLDKRENSVGTKYCAVWDCSITNAALYNHCVAQTKIPAVNTSIACSLYAASGWRPWQTSANECRR